MLILKSTDIIRVVTGSAVSTIGVHTSWVDNAAGVITPDRTNTPITTATTTTVVGSPAASTQRNIRMLAISNNHASSSCVITVQHFDGTTSIDLRTVTLMAGENLLLTEEGERFHYDAAGAVYTYQVPADSNLGATGVIAETMPRETCPEVNTTVGATGTLFLNAIYLTANQLVSNISLCGATTAAGTPTNYRAGLYNGARALLATSADQTTTAFAANTYRTFAMTTPYRVPTSGLYYIGYYMVATTVATLKGGTAKTGGQLGATVPILHGTSSTGLTTTLPDPAAAITTGTASIYAAVS